MSAHHNDVVLAMPPGENYCRHILQELKKIPGINLRMVMQKSIFELPSDAELGDLSQVEIYFGSMNALSKIIHLCVNLKWAQSMAAGSDALWKALKSRQLKPWFTLTRNAITFAGPVSEYVIGQMIAVSRGFYVLREHQKQQMWTKRDPQMINKPLAGSVVCILGLGVIGTELARRCKAFDLEVWGITKDPVVVPGNKPFVDHFRLMDNLSEVLKNADFIVNLLPSTTETRGTLSNQQFSVCTKKPVFINVGRSDVTDEESILEAVRNDWLSWVVLDVFDEEPLPKTSRLWHEPRIILTPHSSSAIFRGDHPRKMCELFMENYQRYQNKEPLLHVVDPDKEY